MYFDESVMTKLLHTIIKSLEIIIWPLRLNFAQKQLQIIQRHKSVSKLSSQPVLNMDTMI